MFFIEKLLCGIFLFVGHILLGQDNITFYSEPNISLNYKVATTYSHNFSMSQRSYLYDANWEVRPRQLDINHFSELKLDYDQSIALGIKYRFRHVFEEDEGNELRLTEQYNIKGQLGNLRLGNRLRAEQRITSALTTHRFRYRLAIDMPLDGEELNVGEAYLVVSTETLLSVARGQGPEYDQRLTTNIGWVLNNETKLEAGVEYRTENYTRSTENVFFFLTSVVFSL